MIIFLGVNGREKNPSRVPPSLKHGHKHHHHHGEDEEDQDSSDEDSDPDFKVPNFSLFLCFCNPRFGFV